MIRASVVDGIFYPADPGELDRTVRDLLNRASSPRPTTTRVIVAPHAAFPVAGEIMAAAYNAVTAEVSRVIILAPMHRDRSDAIVLTESRAFHTPLGDVPVASDVDLESWTTGTLRSDGPHLEEHAIEVQLPFVKVLFPDCRISPVLVGRVGPARVRTLAAFLGEALQDPATLVVATTNMNCPGARRDPIADAERFLSLVLAGDGGGILEADRGGEISACGAEAVAALFMIPGRRLRARLLASGDSGDAAASPVHYAALALEPEGPAA